MWASLWAKIKAFRLPVTTIAGLSALAGTGASYFSGQMALANAVPVAVGAVVAILLPDNADAKAAAQKLAADALVARAAGTSSTTSVPILVTDSTALLKAVDEAQPVPAPK